MSSEGNSNKAMFILSVKITDHDKNETILTVWDIDPYLIEGDTVTYDKMYGVQLYIRKIVDCTREGNSLNGGWNHLIYCTVVGGYPVPDLPPGTPFYKLSTFIGEYAEKN